MLQEEEKTRIRAEEVFRQEVRREIEDRAPKPSKGKRVWSILNSSFALFVLSSLVLGGLTKLYTDYQKRRSEQMQKNETVRRFETEIRNRILEGLTAVRLDSERVERRQMYSAFDLYNEAVRYLNNRVSWYDTVTHLEVQLDFSIYPDYQHRSFASLIAELAAVDTSRFRALQAAKRGYDTLAALADDAGDKEDRSRATDKSVLLRAVNETRDILEGLEDDFSGRPTWRRF